MISVKEIYELRSLRLDDLSLISLYLEGRNPASLERALHALTPEKIKFEEDLGRIRHYIANEFPTSSSEGLALFSASRQGLWLACPLPEGAGNRLSIAGTPVLAPLENLLHQYQRYGIALVNQENARFFEVYLGRIEEISDPANPKPAPTPGVLELQGLARHLQNTADRLMHLARARGFDRVILSAPAALEPLIEDHLHSFLKNNLIVDSQMGMQDSALEILQRVSAGERASRQVRESVLARRLLDNAHAGAMAVVGLSDTLAALERDSVRLLLARDGLSKLGRVCPAGHLSLSGKRCPACYQLTEPIFNLISHMLALALDLNCEVVRVRHDRQLDNVGGIGAQLKFKSQRQAAAPLQTATR